MSFTGENTYTSIQPARTLHHANNNPETPYSAVSSFNLPVTYDSSLVTPVSMSASPHVPRTTSSPNSSKEKPIKMSPVSPTYLGFQEEDGFGATRFHNEPMKYKDPPNALYVSTPESTFPASPYPEPFFGNFGVSAPTTRNPAPSPPLHPHQSPSLHSAGGLSNDSRNSRQPTPGQAYRSHNQTPILIAPNPASLRKDSGVYRQNSIQSNHSHGSGSHSHGLPQMHYSPQHHDSHMLPSSGSKKRKSPDSGLDHEYANGNQQMTGEEQLLLRLTDQLNLPWKDVMARFNDETGKSMKVPALQMRKKRLLERLRERALTMAMEDYDKQRWETIARDMLKHGSTEKWTKEAVQRKWYEMHPNGSPLVEYASPGEYELGNRVQYQRPGMPYSPQTPMGGYHGMPLHQRHHSYSGPPETHKLPPSHPLHAVQQVALGLPPLRPASPDLMNLLPPFRHQNTSPPTVSMDEVRSRAGSDASQQMAMHQKQAQMMFEEQKRREEGRMRALLEVGGQRAATGTPLPSQVYAQSQREGRE
ncbi:hypothetical protein GLAREA_08441 [Glarea lozoyensis ATCC 20868]|uniref:Uncharacterized protein n=1 Tax=Glarea lozoyensis (strain ATCC 20868 / MF5171) TaxID=1116229 RepID=S3CH18_GLAL2|nr:uncharacterized protein GLAREA_08441 [Glarea lozoyensis ATCC 20868]EPE24589.1 hypothetical protein GLAREA_08441 [Glarea lozoyensis ATCC 20868]